MAGLKQLEDTIDQTKDLHSVVKTMKSLAAVNIRLFEKAADAAGEYNHTVEMAWKILLRDWEDLNINFNFTKESPLGVIVLGSEQGMSGQFNEIISEHTRKILISEYSMTAVKRVLVIGSRARGRLEEYDVEVTGHIPMTSSLGDVTELVNEAIIQIEGWRTYEGVQRVIMFYNERKGKARYRPAHTKILPLDEDWFKRLRNEPWPNKQLPGFRQNREDLFRDLLRQTIFVKVYQAFVESLASENASRLSSMQAAEDNINNRLEELNTQYNRERQSSITSEMLDIVSGFEALK
ncbi:MAG: F0F1 ATP synthase subunit gamma [Spirochaetia bacterium]